MIAPTFSVNLVLFKYYHRIISWSRFKEYILNRHEDSQVIKTVSVPSHHCHHEFKFV